MYITENFLVRGAALNFNSSNEIIIKGKRYNINWIDGYYIFNGIDHQIVHPLSSFDETQIINVIPESIVKYTGVNDYQNNRIFERDFIKWRDEILKIIWDNRLLTYRAICVRTLDNWAFNHITQDEKPFIKIGNDFQRHLIWELNQKR